MTDNVEHTGTIRWAWKAEQFQNAQAIELLKSPSNLIPGCHGLCQDWICLCGSGFQPEKAVLISNALSSFLRHSHLEPALHRAWSAIARSNYTVAIGILQQITNQYPNETEAYCQLSRLLRDRKE